MRRLEKLKEYTTELVTGFINTRERFAFLEPMISNKDLARRMSGLRAHGFVTIRQALFLDGVQTVAKLCFDTDGRAPSIARILATLRTPQVREALREEHRDI